MTPPFPPPEVTWQTVRHSASDNLLLKGLVSLLNRAWPGSRPVLDEASYRELNRCYWARQQNGLLACTLSAQETSALAARCKAHGVSVTGALAAAFLLAQAGVLPHRNGARQKVSVPVNIRDRLLQSPGLAVGVYASGIDIVLRSRPSSSFWKLALQAHVRIHKALGNRPRLLRPLVLEGLDPSIADGLAAAVATDQWTRGHRLLSGLARVKAGTRCLTVTNIGRVTLPDLGTPYRLDTLCPLPPIGPGSRMMLAVLTVGGQMNVVVKYRQNEMDEAAAVRIRDRALGYILGL